MCYPGGELPERGEFFRLDQAILGVRRSSNELASSTRACLDTFEQPRVLYYAQNRLRAESLK
jgi:hypothetical protein